MDMDIGAIRCSMENVLKYSFRKPTLIEEITESCKGFITFLYLVVGSIIIAIVCDLLKTQSVSGYIGFVYGYIIISERHL